MRVCVCTIPAFEFVGFLLCQNTSLILFMSRSNTQHVRCVKLSAIFNRKKCIHKIIFPKISTKKKHKLLRKIRRRISPDTFCENLPRNVENDLDTSRHPLIESGCTALAD